MVRIWGFILTEMEIIRVLRKGVPRSASDILIRSHTQVYEPNEEESEKTN